MSMSPMTHCLRRGLSDCCPYIYLIIMIKIVTSSLFRQSLLSRSLVASFATPAKKVIDKPTQIVNAFTDKNIEDSKEQKPTSGITTQK